MPSVNACLAPRTIIAAALIGAACTGFCLAEAFAQTTQTAQIPTAGPAAPGNGAGAAPPRPAPGRTAQGQQPPVAEPPAAPSAEACDDACVRRGADFAAQTCVPLIEAKATLDYDWLSHPFGGMFTQAEKPGADGIIRYRGDAIRILTQNQWLRHAYECAFDPVERKIVAVQVRLGRLVPPVEVAQVAGAPVGQGPQQGQQTPQTAPQAGQPQPTAKPRPPFGEPSAISITQAHLRTGQIDSLIRISQVSRSRTQRTRRTPGGQAEPR